MYFKDLTPYEYYLPFNLPNVYNVGWLEKEFDFTKGSTRLNLVEKLYETLMKEGTFEIRVNQIRGVHSCNLCQTHRFDVPFLGACELWLPSLEVGKYFAAPSLIIHYIEKHEYCPPKSFNESLLQLNLNEKFNGQQVYDDLIKAHAPNV